MAHKILAVVSEALSGDELKKAVGAERAEDAEVLVIAPALNSRSRFWLSDSDPAIERAEQVQEETVQRMVEDGVDAAGDTGESDPLLAIQDALATFEADEIVIFSRPGAEGNWAEAGAVEEAERRFERPVRHLPIDAGSS
ncbi:MAG TPA: hypothetical protein VEQ61_06560 [Thermoleophilaceae bacterium]|nr:hypothetical protein [Thermoleophilaceae bacterium]